MERGRVRGVGGGGGAGGGCGGVLGDEGDLARGIAIEREGDQDRVSS